MFTTKGKFFTENERRESFKVWPFNEDVACNKTRMAEAGFYWSGNDIDVDTATCFVCHKVLDGWEATDDPWFEHQKHAPQCAFVKLGKAENDLTVEDVYNLLEIVLRNGITKKFNEDKKHFLMRVDKMRDKIQKDN